MSLHARCLRGRVASGASCGCRKRVEDWSRERKCCAADNPVAKRETAARNSRRRLVASFRYCVRVLGTATASEGVRKIWPRSLFVPAATLNGPKKRVS